MSTAAERVVVGLLTDTESLKSLAREGLELELLPSPGLRPVVQWALGYLRQGNRAPTADVIVRRWETDRHVLSDHEVDVHHPPEETMESAVEELRADFGRSEVSRFTRSLVHGIAECAPEERRQVIAAHSAELAMISTKLEPGTTAVDLRTGALDMLAEYDRVAASGNPIRGLTFGLPEVDAHTRGVWDGEVAVVMAPPKQGKSWFADFVAVREWERGRVVALYTMENSIEMTQLRLACVALGLSIQELQDGKLDAEDYDKLKTWVHDVLDASDVPLHIFHPDEDMRTPAQLVQQARAYGADSIILDQLTFMSPTTERKAGTKPDEIWRTIKELAVLVSTGRHLLPCLLIHQVNREGEEYIEKHGHAKARHAAEGSGVERTCSFAFALHANRMQQANNLCTFEQVAGRRVPPGAAWELNRHIDVGKMSVRCSVAPA